MQRQKEENCRSFLHQLHNQRRNSSCNTLGSALCNQLALPVMRDLHQDTLSSDWDLILVSAAESVKSHQVSFSLGQREG